MGPPENSFQYEALKSSLLHRAMSKQRVLPGAAVAIYMQDREPEGAGNELDEEDEWQLYASAGYASSELDAEEKNSEGDKLGEIWFDGDDFDFEGSTVNWNSPPCPAPLGIAHVIKIGVCNHCLFRISGFRSRGSGPDSGAAIREEALLRDRELQSKIIQDYCPLCENLFDDIENIVDRLFETLSDTDFSTMQFGIHLPKDLLQEEDRIRSKYGAPGSYHLKGAIVESIHERIRELDKKVDFVKEKPDVMILVDGLTLRVDVDVRPIFLYGRYRKLSRGIPQTRWPCRACRGRALGCKSCEGTGLQYVDSVQDLIGEPIREALGAEDTSFHGMGREDIDVRCLGSGRPFVLEVKRPSRRQFPVEDLVEMVKRNAPEKVEVDNLRWCSKKEIHEVKQSRSEKTYMIRFRAEGLDDNEIAEQSILSLEGQVIDQETPKRVSHRRAAKTRRRKITSIDKVSFEGEEVEITLRCEAGTYIKELVHSDEGRTTPSVQSVLGKDCEVIRLDVLEIHAD
ncbi:MAG TPA: tRNA pseudouridine(54/55) synthase Pus10 [Candidatus Poseidoniales archaeon]|nr:MAG: tRNA pseudouridine(54/55) synthase Pus10 [Euryarchaeota archaeon]HIG34495.1 tRNA pseudouridine(54/55) synthase Pus10 [Candidatus Poseidoniales archaeon]HIL67994.1 tRNA pseudouridine(54/55) synthase Pus10 [Candidatus Poseidoniales archaeon]